MISLAAPVGNIYSESWPILTERSCRADLQSSLFSDNVGDEDAKNGR